MLFFFGFSACMWYLFLGELVELPGFVSAQDQSSKDLTVAFWYVFGNMVRGWWVKVVLLDPQENNMK